jgi:magnesium-transporting ATPase (P-type)
MSDAQNPYQAPSIAASEERKPQYLPDRAVFSWYLNANQVVSSLFIAIGFGGAMILIVMLFRAKADPALSYASGVALAILIALGMAGVYQRRHNLIAMFVTASLGTALVIFLLACIPFGVLQGIFAGNMPWGMALATTLLIVGLSYVFITPLRLVIQAWRWTQAGVNLAAFEKEIHRRA